MTLYVWLKLFHLLGVVVFLFAHGVSGGASFAIGRAPEADTRRLLRISQVSAKSDDVLTAALTRTQPRAAAIFGGIALVLLVALMVLKPF